MRDLWAVKRPEARRKVLPVPSGGFNVCSFQRSINSKNKMLQSGKYFILNKQASS